MIALAAPIILGVLAVGLGARFLIRTIWPPHLRLRPPIHPPRSARVVDIRTRRVLKPHDLVPVPQWQRDDDSPGPNAA